MLLHPEVANRDCGHCQQVLYNEKTGAVEKNPRTNEPIKRPPMAKTPCRIDGLGCPKGTPEAQKTLTPQNDKCYRHYIGCKITGQWPDDAIVLEHAILIRRIEEQVERMRQERLTMLLEATLGIPR